MDAVEVRRSPRARRWRLEVPWGEPARLTVPRWMSRAEVERLLVQEQPWLEEQRRRQVPRLGLEQLAVSESEARIGARELVSALAEEESRRVGVAYARIRIGDQRNRWGSCSSRGTLSFSWRLVLAPFEVLDYVVVHELCHLRVPNHSKSSGRLSSGGVQVGATSASGCGSTDPNCWRFVPLAERVSRKPGPLWCEDAGPGERIPPRAMCGEITSCQRDLLPAGRAR